MPVIRSILTVVIVISIALLPVAAGLAVASPSNVTVMADRNSMPCCPDRGIQDNFKSTQCLLKCVTLAGAILPAIAIALPRLAGQSEAPFKTDNLHGLLGRPPTRPPPA